jgi:hypothetical protein
MPMLPPPRPRQAGGRGNGRVLAYAVGGLAIIGAAVGLGIALGSKPTPTPVAVSSSTTITTTVPAPDSTRYRLTSPDTVAGDFQKDRIGTHNNAIAPNASDQVEYTPIGVQLTGALTAIYHQGETTADTNATGYGMMVFGLWGKIGDPQRAVDGAPSTMIKDLLLTNNAFRPVGELVPESPNNLDDGAVMACQFIEGRFRNTDAEVPLCVWADHSTMCVIGIVNPNLSLADAADIASQVRDESRRPTF